MRAIVWHLETTVRVGGRQDQHGVGGRLLQGLEKAVLGRFCHPLRVREKPDPLGGDEWLETQKLLERLLVRLSAFLRVEADLIDADRLRAIVRPEVRMHVQTSWLAGTQEQFLPERAGHRRFADPFVAGQAIRVG